MDIDQAYAELADGIREYVRKQVRLWQEMPYCALEADGRTRWLGLWKVAYREGLWLPGYHLGNGGYTPPAVDCATGEFVHRYPFGGQLQPVTEPDRIVPLMRDRGMLNAAQLLEKMRKTTAACTQCDIEHNNAERERFRRLYDVQPVYVRRTPVG